METPIRISLVEDDARLRQALATLLEGTPGYACLSAHATAEDALKNIPTLKPDLALVDLNLPGMKGVELIARLKASLPELRLVVLTNFDEHDLIFDSLRAGADGYLLKRTPPAEILDAIEIVHRGGSMMTPSVARKLVSHFRRQPQPLKPDEQLTKRETEVLHLAKQGWNYKRIATELNLTYDSVRTHFRNIYQKLHVHSLRNLTHPNLEIQSVSRTRERRSLAYLASRDRF